MSSTQAYFTHRDRLCIVTLFSVCAWLDPLINQWSFFVKYVINVSFKLFLLTCRHYLVRNEYHKQSVIHLSRWIKRQLKLYSTSQTSNHLRFAGTGVLQEGQYQYFKNISMAFLDRRSWDNFKEFGNINYPVAFYILTKHHTLAYERLTILLELCWCPLHQCIVYIWSVFKPHFSLLIQHIVELSVVQFCFTFVFIPYNGCISTMIAIYTNFRKISSKIELPPLEQDLGLVRFSSWFVMVLLVAHHNSLF